MCKGLAFNHRLLDKNYLLWNIWLSTFATMHPGLYIFCNACAGKKFYIVKQEHTVLMWKFIVNRKVVWLKTKKTTIFAIEK